MKNKKGSGFLSRIQNLVQRNWVLVLIMLLGVFLRFYKLNEIPAEMWGDVIEGYKFAQSVLGGNYYWRFIFGGDGPLFSYIIAPITFVFGLSFLTMKLASSLVGIALVGAVYFLGKEYAGKEIGLLAAFFLAVSKWPLIFSRMAKPHILVPLFVALTFYFLFGFIKTKKRIYGIITGMVLGLGMYTQSGFWGVPLAVGLILLVKNRKKSVYVLIPAAVLVIPLVWEFFQSSSLYISDSSFFAEKMTVEGGLSVKLRLFLINIIKNLAMFNIKGDVGIRSNPSGKPHLDFISGLLFLLGAFQIFRSKKLKTPVLLIYMPFFVLQIPSILDIANPLSTPNAGRTIALLPFVYILVAIGLIHFFDKLRADKFIKKYIVATILVMVTYLNFNTVFVDYANGLPNKNIPVGKIIAEKIDGLPLETKVIIIGCCWNSGQPEPNAIRFVLRNKRGLNFFEADNNQSPFSCDKMNKSHGGSRELFFVVNPYKRNEFKKIRDCFPKGEGGIIEGGGLEIARTYRL